MQFSSIPSVYIYPLTQNQPNTYEEVIKINLHKNSGLHLWLDFKIMTHSN
jgi:hypothetical protein